MSAFIVTCCSTADMKPSYFEKRGIPYACFHLFLDGKEYWDDLGQSMPFEEFYARIDAGALPSTSNVNVGEFMAFFEPYLQDGKDILHISFSSGLSGAFQSACMARDELRKLYPDRTIHVVDSLAASSGYGLMVDLAADMRDDGLSLGETRQFLEENKLRLQQYCASSDLTHYKRGGRISPTSAFVGTLLHICPVVKMSRDGHLTPFTKVRSKSKTLLYLLQRMQNYAHNRTDYAGKCYICHSARYANARFLADKIEAAFPNLKEPVTINDIGAVIGAHTGPGTVGLFFWGDERE